ncbi:eukaryotic translation initiation factor 5A [Artemisia annua]|uniref:Eukaryotic translation initiation factor 5A n=1 Tax=Artemisia annua TaxID=35608 RepID=A0A2U1M240_ARTAN|nr:eukaryotic translation initiation factor 5A [Artemisia annua]
MGVFVVEVSTSKTGKHGHAKCHFVAIDIFNGKKLEDIVPSSHNCDVSLLTESGDTKDDLKLPTDDALLKQLEYWGKVPQDLRNIACKDII